MSVIKWSMMLLFMAVFVNNWSGVTTCPDRCLCYVDNGYNSANCYLPDLATAHQTSIKSLKIHQGLHNFPMQLTSEMFIRFVEIEILILKNCSLQYLPNNVFYNLRIVRKIDLSYNNIHLVNGEVFKNLDSLQTLILKNNIIFLTSHNTITSNSLEELDLSYCGLRAIPQGAFTKVPRLSTLYLVGNKFYTLNLDRMPKALNFLNISNNNINVVQFSANALQTLKNLKKIDARENPVKCNCELVLLQRFYSRDVIILSNITSFIVNFYKNQNPCTIYKLHRSKRALESADYNKSQKNDSHLLNSGIKVVTAEHISNPHNTENYITETERRSKFLLSYKPSSKNMDHPQMNHTSRTTDENELGSGYESAINLLNLKEDNTFPENVSLQKNTYSTAKYNPLDLINNTTYENCSWIESSDKVSNISSDEHSNKTKKKLSHQDELKGSIYELLIAVVLTTFVFLMFIISCILLFKTFGKRSKRQYQPASTIEMQTLSVDEESGADDETSDPETPQSKARKVGETLLKKKDSSIKNEQYED